METELKQPDPSCLQWKPTYKWRHRNDHFFDEGNKECHLTSKFFMTDSCVQDEEIKSKTTFPCKVSTCKLNFHSIADYEMHYNTVHMNVCSECHKNFPSAHLLEIHVLEWHDNMFSLLAKKTNMYQCLIEACPEKFANPQQRKEHMIKTHRYPANFRFDKPPPKFSKSKKAVPEKKMSLAQMQMEMENETVLVSNNTKADVTETELLHPTVMEAEGGEDGCETCRMETNAVPPTSRKFVYNAPKNFSFGQGVSKGFSRPAQSKNKAKQWHQQIKEKDTKKNIEDVKFMELVDTLEEIRSEMRKTLNKF